MGFRVEFPRSVVDGLRPNAPEVIEQDSLARAVGLFTENLVAEHTGSMLWWTSYYPGKLARLPCDADASETMREFHSDCKAFWEAQECRQRRRR
ncbi:MAG: hypothetical protein GY772_27985 [bacterium]|nr:hypothetical protein [bacterium]